MGNEQLFEEGVKKGCASKLGRVPCALVRRVVAAAAAPCHQAIMLGPC